MIPRPRLALSALLLAAVTPLPLLTGDDPPGFRDDFSTYVEGSSGAPRWRAMRGEWKVRGGKLVQLKDGEGHAIAADSGLESGGFRLEARFRTVAGIPGEGIVFGLRGPDKLAGCHVVRVDPEGLYYGVLDASGEFRGEGPVPAFVEGGAWNTLVVVASARSGTFAIELNGKTAARGIPLEHRGRWVGLVSSWGEQEFALFEAAPEREPTSAGPSRPEEGPATGVDDLRQPVDIASSQEGSLVVLDRVAPPLHVLGSDLRPRARFGRLLEGDRPIAVKVGPDGAVYVLDEAAGRIDRYPAEGAPPDGDPARIAPDAAPRAIAAEPHLAGPRGLAAFADGRIVVAEAGAGRVVILSAGGGRLEEVGKRGGGPGEHERPSDVAIDSLGRILVADFKGCRVQAFARDNAGAKGEGGPGPYRLDARSPWLAPPGRLAVSPGDRVLVLGRFAYYETGGALRILERDLKPRGFAGVFAAGSLSEEGGLAVGTATGVEDEFVSCLSRRDGRLYRFPSDFEGPADARLEVNYLGGKTAVAWSTPHLERLWGAAGTAGGWTLQGRLQYREAQHGGAAAGTWKDGPELKGYVSPLARLEGLDPLVPYDVRVFPHHGFLELASPVLALEDRDSTSPWSKPYRFYGAPPPGRMRYLDLSVACAVYLSHEDAGPGRRFSVPRERMGERLPRQFEMARRFFARNTRLRLHVHADFEVIDDATAVVKHGWLDPGQVRRDLSPRLEKRGRKVEDYDSLIGVWVDPGWRGDVDDDPGTVGGGGLTSFGYSTFGTGGRPAWLFCHEYHHQIDAFFNRSGHLDYPLNHPDATVQPGRYGQHWDCNAFFLRGWPDEAWFRARFGKVLWTDDSDGDGVPDRDPSLPFDEARLGTDPAKRDTDKDGLSDLEEIVAGTFRGADPLESDTDRDGTRDGADARPLDAAFSGSPVLRRGTPALDGAFSRGEWQGLGSFPGTGAGAGAALFARWDEKALYFAARSARPVRIHLEIDAADDGWFLEDDNRVVELSVNGGARPEAQGAARAETAGSKVDGILIAEVAVPWEAVPAVRPVKGARFGLCARLTYREGDGDAALERELFLVDPWELLELTLEDG